MKIYRAETGKRIRVRKPFESLDDLKVELEQLSGVPTSSQILMTSFGTQLKSNMIHDANKAVGKDEYIIFLFDRELLDENNTNNIESLIDEVLLEPPIIAIAASTVPTKLQKRSTLNNINLSDECGAYVNLFQTYHSQGQSFIKAASTHVEFCERLYQEQKMQLMALGVGITNLDSHCRSVIDAHEDFYTFSEKEITKQTKLIKSLSTNIETLRRITIHPKMLKDTTNLTNDKDTYTLGDFITEDKLIILAKEGKQTYDQMSKRIQDLTSLVRSVQSGTESLKNKKFDSFFPKMEESLSNIQGYNNKLKQIAEKLERDVTRVQSQVSKILESNTKTLSTTTTKSIEAFEHLSDIQSQDYLPEMQNYDQYIREQVKFLVQCKNTMTTTLISSLQQISRLESSIAGIPSSLSGLDSEVRSKAQDFKSLAYVHQMPTAYARTIVEIVRRKEYAKIILTKAQQMAEIMAHFRNMEQKRRESYRMDVKKYVPVNIPALDDNPPMCDISTANIKEDKLPSFTAEDIHSFSNFIEEIRPAVVSQASFHRSPTFTASLSKTRPSNDDPLANLQAVLLKLASQIEGMNYEFDHIVEKTFLSEKNDNDRNVNTISRPISLIDGRSLTPQLVPTLPQFGRRSKRLSRQSFSEDSSPQIDVNMDLYFEKTKQLDKAEEKIKAYETRIKSLENILHTNYQAAKSSSVLSSKTRQNIADSKTSITTLVSDEEIADLRSRYQNLESSYTTEVNEKRKQEKKVNELETNYKNLEVSYKEIVNEKETLLKRISELESRYQDSELSHAESMKEVEKRASNLETRYQEIESSYADAANIKSSLEEKVDELQKYSEDLESSYALAMKEKETLSNKHVSLQDKFNELQNSYNSSIMRCNELETKVDELEQAALDNKQGSFILDLEQKNQDLQSEKDEYERKLDIIQNELKEQSEELGILNEAKSKLESELAEKKTRFEKEVAKIENSHKQNQSELKKRIEELEDQQIGQEQIEAIEERWKKKIEELQKKEDEKIQEHESIRNNLLHEIDGWKDSLNKMNLARDECEEQLDKTRERVKLSEKENSEKKAALEQVEKLVKKITEEILKYMPAVNAYDSSNSSNSNEKKKLETSLNPINMIRKVGSVVNSMSQELHANKQLIEKSKADNVDLEKSLEEIRQKLNERTECSRLLNKCLWEYYNNLRTLISAMGLSLPLKTENRSISITSTEEEKGNHKPSESRLSDSYYAQDLGKFFSKDFLNEPTEWPKDKYETLLTLSTKVDLNEVSDMIRKTPKDAENLIKKYQHESKLNKEKYRKANQESKDKIAFRNFKNHDLALFLPTRNSTAKPWAAFNINFPHYFLRATDTVINQIRNRDWIVARIVNITECIVDMKNPITNPYDLPDGVKFYMLDVDGFQNNLTSSIHHRKRSESESSFKPSRIMSASLSNLAPIRDNDDTPSSSSSSTVNISTSNVRRTTMPPTRTNSSSSSTSPALNSLKSFFFSSNGSGSDTKENNQPYSDL